MSGVVTPSDALGQLALYVQKPGSSRWVLIGRPVLSVSGTWNFNYAPHGSGSYRFLVRFTTPTGTITSSTASMRSRD